MEKENFVVELPLKVEKWQADLLDKRYELLRGIYNYVQSKLLRQFRYFEQMSEWKKCKTKKDKQRFMETHPFTIKGFKKPIILCKMKSKDIEADVYGVTNFVEQIVKNKVSADKTYKDFGINTTNINALAQHIWSAWEKKLYGKPKIIKDKKTGEFIKIPNKIHFKKSGDINTISLREKKGNFTGLDVDLEHMVLYFNTNGKRGTKSKKITLPIVFSNPTEYEMYALKNGIESVRVVTIVRKLIRGKYKFYVQFTIEGEKPQKGRTLGKGEVGVDVGPSTIAVSSLNGVQINTLAEKCDNIEHACKLLERKMDRSKRATNPQNYNDDGTIKKIRGKKIKWNYSNRYIKTRNKKRELHRKQAAIRKLQHNIDCNELLKLGKIFIVENNPISAWQRKATETKINKKGKYQSKKRFGKSIANHAPAMFITILENKVKSLGGQLIRVDIKNAASRFDFTNSDFVEHKLNERKITLSNGNTHQRDLLAAFNLQHLRYNDENLKNYNIEDMERDYPIFCKLETIEINKFINNQKSHKSTVGY